MFRLSKKTRGELMRAELGETWDHFLQAATHAANGVGQSVGPRSRRMRGAASRGWQSTSAAFAPLAAAYREGAADASAAALKLKNKATSRKKGKNVSNKKMGMLIGLLAVGAAAGAAGALLMRRRRKQQWSEYDPTEALDSVSPDSRATMEDARSMVDKATTKGSSTMDKVTHRASKAMDKTADKLHSAASSMRKSDFESKAGFGSKPDFGSKVDEAAEAANDATDELKSKLSSTTKNSTRP